MPDKLTQIDEIVSKLRTMESTDNRSGMSRVRDERGWE